MDEPPMGSDFPWGFAFSILLMIALIIAAATYRSCQSPKTGIRTAEKGGSMARSKTAAVLRRIKTLGQILSETELNREEKRKVNDALRGLISANKMGPAPLIPHPICVFERCTNPLPRRVSKQTLCLIHRKITCRNCRHKFMVGDYLEDQGRSALPDGHSDHLPSIHRLRRHCPNCCKNDSCRWCNARRSKADAE